MILLLYVDMYRNVSSYNFVISCNINFVEKPVGRKCVFFLFFYCYSFLLCIFYQEKPYSGNENLLYSSCRSDENFCVDKVFNNKEFHTKNTLTLL